MLIDRERSPSSEETYVVLTGGDRGNLRFARNTATTSGATSGYSLAVTASFGRKSGTVTTAEFDDTSLRQAIAAAEEIARLSPENPEAMPVLGPQTYGTAKAYFETWRSEPDGARRRDTAIELSNRRRGNRGFV